MKNKPINLVKLFTLLHVVIGGTLSIASLLTGHLDIYYATEYLINNYTFYIIAQILFLIYIFAFYNKKPKHVLLPISYIFYVCHLGLVLIRNDIPNFQAYLEINSFVALFRFISVNVLGEHLVPIVFFVFLIIVCFTKFKLIPTARKMVIIYSVISIAMLLLSIPTFIEIREQFQYVNNEYHMGNSGMDYIYKSYFYKYFASLTFLFNIIANFFLWRFALPNKIKVDAK